MLGVGEDLNLRNASYKLVSWMEPRGDARALLNQRTSINDIILNHILSRLGSLLLVDRVRLVPVVPRDETKLDFRICDGFDTTDRSIQNHCFLNYPEGGRYLLFELLRERFIIQKDVWVVELVIPSILELLNAASDAVDITIACWSEEERVGVSPEVRLRSEVGAEDVPNITIVAFARRPWGEVMFFLT